MINEASLRSLADRTLLGNDVDHLPREIAGLWKVRMSCPEQNGTVHRRHTVGCYITAGQAERFRSIQLYARLGNVDLEARFRWRLADFPSDTMATGAGLRGSLSLPGHRARRVQGYYIWPVTGDLLCVQHKSHQ